MVHRGGWQQIGRVTTAGVFSEFPIPTANSQPAGITAGPDGALWFTEGRGNNIGRITTAGTITNEFPIPTGGSLPAGITSGPDGNLWFAEFGPSGNIANFGKIGRITPAGTFQEFALPVGAAPQNGATGSDGALWFIDRER